MLGLGLKAGFGQGSGSGAKSSPAPFSNTKSLFTDGVDDYFEVKLASDVVDHGSGTISFWVNADAALAATSYCFELYDASQPADGKMNVRFFKTATNFWSLDGFYKDETSVGVYEVRLCQAKTGSSHHGEPFSRVSTDYGLFGSPTLPVYNAYYALGGWHHIAFTWDRDLDYTYNSTTYNGSLKIYFDGALVNHGVSTGTASNTRGTATGLNSFSSTTVLDTLRIATNSGQQNPLDALTDEVALFGAALSDSDIFDIYNHGAPGDLSSYSDLVGWWRFENNGKDSSSNSNDGSLYNGAAYDTGIPS